MKFEFDQTARNIETIEGDVRIVFRTTSFYQYSELCERLLAPKQWEHHIGLSHDGIFDVAAKRLKAGLDYMQNNSFNPKQEF